MKKTIIALAAASSVALSHGVAVAEETNNTVTTASVQTENTTGSSELKDKLTGSSEKGQQTEDNKDGDTTKPEGEEKPSAKGSSAADFFKWNEDTSDWKKFQDIAKAIAGVVALLGSISALFANIEKIVKQFTNFGK